ncbi:sulfotransferase family protein [Halobellus sp. EA9]|uniref:sulfotransferase family protein n=1 Tax=Halobellus sp. EA9 TaxID=3421647 RepID=UPI003EC06F8E
MSTGAAPDFIYGGPSKSGSSWVYKALKEHPQIHVPDLKPVNYFNTKYHQGSDWYRSVFAEADPDQIVGESSPGYINNESAPKRVAADFPDVKVMFTLRNPIDRAFSQWWHDTQSGWLNFDFDDIFFVDQAYEVFIRPGYYADHVERWQTALSEEQVEIFLFDDFVEDNATFIESIYEFIGVDPGYQPDIIDERVNQARYRGPALYDEVKGWFVHDAPIWLRSVVSPVYPVLRSLFENKSAYKEGIDENIRKELEVEFASPTKRLSEMIDRDLNHWFDHIDLDAGDYRSQVTIPADHKSKYRHWTTDRMVTKNYQRRRN